MLPELSNNREEEPIALGNEYSSADEVLDLKGTVSLLREHKLTVVRNLIDAQDARDAIALRDWPEGDPEVQ